MPAALGGGDPGLAGILCNLVDQHIGARKNIPRLLADGFRRVGALAHGRLLEGGCELLEQVLEGGGHGAPVDILATAGGHGLLLFPKPASHEATDGLLTCINSTRPISGGA